VDICELALTATWLLSIDFRSPALLTGTCRILQFYASSSSLELFLSSKLDAGVKPVLTCNGLGLVQMLDHEDTPGIFWSSDYLFASLNSCF